MSKKKTGRKVKCWLCGSWQDEAYTILMDFNGMEERVCYDCKLRMDTREDQLEQKNIELSMYEEGAEVTTKVTKKETNEEGDPDEIPAKEDFLP